MNAFAPFLLYVRIILRTLFIRLQNGERFLPPSIVSSVFDPVLESVKRSSGSTSLFDTSFGLLLRTHASVVESPLQIPYEATGDLTLEGSGIFVHFESECGTNGIGRMKPAANDQGIGSPIGGFFDGENMTF